MAVLFGGLRVTLTGMCPHCGRDAPLVYRGVVPYCTACGGVRLPLSGPSINLAGRPSRVGGVVASAAGGVVLVGGVGLSFLVGGLLYALTTMEVALVVAVPLAVVALVVGLSLWIGGRRLAQSGAEQQHATVDGALLQLAEERGAISAADAARALGLTASEADARLTEVAKRQPERMAVDLDDQGGIWYRALSPGGRGGWPDVGVRVGDSSPSAVAPAPVAADAGDAAEYEEEPDERRLRR